MKTAGKKLTSNKLLGYIVALVILIVVSEKAVSAFFEIVKKLF